MKPLTKEQIDQVFEQAKEPADYVIGLYKLAFPDWDDIEQLHGFPEISKDTNAYIFRKAQSFDRDFYAKKYANDPISRPMPAGLWFNNGFSGKEGVPDWKVRTAHLQVTRTRAEAAA